MLLKLAYQLVACYLIRDNTLLEYGSMLLFYVLVLF